MLQGHVGLEFLIDLVMPIAGMNFPCDPFSSGSLHEKGLGSSADLPGPAILQGEAGPVRSRYTSASLNWEINSSTASTTLVERRTLSTSADERVPTYRCISALRGCLHLCNFQDDKGRALHSLCHFSLISPNLFARSISKGLLV